MFHGLLRTQRPTSLGGNRIKSIKLKKDEQHSDVNARVGLKAAITTETKDAALRK